MYQAQFQCQCVNIVENLQTIIKSTTINKKNLMVLTCNIGALIVSYVFKQNSV